MPGRDEASPTEKDKLMILWKIAALLIIVSISVSLYDRFKPNREE
jgi:hypothetical protein